MQHRARRVASLGTVSTIAALVLMGCGAQQAETTKPHTLVTVTQIALEDMSDRQVLTGAIQARAETPVAFMTSGQVAALNVNVGDRVAPGDVLARLTAAEQEADVDAATAGLEAADGRLSLAQTTLDRQNSLWDQGLATRTTLDSAQTAWETARNARDSARAQLDLARETLGYTELKAKTAGVVTRRLFEVDEVVQAGAPVFSIAEDGPRKAVLNVGETAIAQWDRTRPVEVALVSAPDSATKGYVTEVAPALDATGTVQVKVTLDAQANLPLGAAVTATFDWPGQNRIVLPAQALWEAGGKPAVWVVADDGKVSIVAVQVEGYETDGIVITDGLSPGQTVVTSGTQFLTPGQQVEVQKAGL